MKKHLIIFSYKTIIAALIFSFTFISCDKDNEPASDEEQPMQVEETASTGSTAQPVITIAANATVPPTKTKYNFMFDWEKAQSMPVAWGKPPVPMPWSDQAIRNYDPGLRYDYKKSDGWELVYNSWSDSVNWADPFFILYNKYRGVVRYYTYNEMESSAAINSTFHSLINGIRILEAVRGTTHMLNFADQLIVDMKTNSTFVSLLEPWPIVKNAWYLSQFEIAYDPTLGNKTWQDFQLAWDYNFAHVMELSVNHKQPGNKMLFLQSPYLSFYTLTESGMTVGGRMQAHVKSPAGLNELFGIISTPVLNNLKKTLFDSTAGNKLNATLVPKLGVADTKLDVPVLVRLDPNLVGYIRLSLASPGFSNTDVPGFGPAFNEPLGIFYLGAPPVINHTKAAGPLPEQYTLDIASLEYIINPFIQNYASVRNFRQEIVAAASNTPANLTEAKLYHGQQLKASTPLNILGVRVSFEVLPKSGTAPVTIIKTFKADLRNS